MSFLTKFASADSCLSPVNISSTDKSIKECNIYCSYHYDYNDSSCIVTNNKNDPVGNYLDIKYELKNSGTSAQVRFNGENYNVSSIRVYQPSLHTYDGQHVPVELLILHDGPTYKGGNTKKLIVSVPYQSGSGSSNYTSSKSGGRVLENIITDYYKLVPPPPPPTSTTQNKAAIFDSMNRAIKSASPQSLNINNFNLNNFIPSTQYYNYIASDLPNFGMCRKEVITHYILFDINQGAQYISSHAITKLQALISKSNFPVKKNTLFKSSKFPNSDSIAAKADDIYIDCKPTGSEGEELYKPATDSKEKESNISKMVDSLKNSGIVQFLASIILSIVLIWAIKKAFFKKSNSIPSVNSGGSGGSGGSGDTNAASP